MKTQLKIEVITNLQLELCAKKKAQVQVLVCGEYYSSGIIKSYSDESININGEYCLRRNSVVYLCDNYLF